MKLTSNKINSTLYENIKYVFSEARPCSRNNNNIYYVFTQNFVNAKKKKNRAHCALFRFIAYIVYMYTCVYAYV